MLGQPIKILKRIPISLQENGVRLSLECVLFKPEGQGPFPVLLFLHGATGWGDDPSIFGITYSEESIAQLFNSRGWMVAFPQRRGRGQSDGLYDEGFEPDRSRYTANPQISLAGLGRALEDTNFAADWLLAQPDVDPQNVFVGGQSRGGILAVAIAAKRQADFRGAVNFVGGWVGDRFSTASAINTPVFAAAGQSRTPSIWLYGRDDPYYSMSHSRSNFDAYVAAGGKGSFFEFDPVGVENGHRILKNPELWHEPLWTFVEANMAKSP